jgi:hypothetical protein
MCPKWQNAEHVNKAQGWALFRKALANIGNDYLEPNIDCVVCKKKFSLLEGVNEAFCSDLATDNFRHNSEESGTIEITVGQLSEINFAEPFLDIPVINLTPYLKPVNAVAGYVTSKGFSIFSSAKICSTGEKALINWHASGNRASAPIPLWRVLLSSAKDHQKNKNFRSEIVELESAFEVFIGEYLSKALEPKLRQETINWLLKRSIEEQLSIAFTELYGNSLSKMHNEEYSRWSKFVKEKRDSVVHRGIAINEEEARDARRAVLDLIVTIDKSAIEHFQIQMKNIGEDGPYRSFGMAVVKGKKST